MQLAAAVLASPFRIFGCAGNFWEENEENDSLSLSLSPANRYVNTTITECRPKGQSGLWLSDFTMVAHKDLHVVMYDELPVKFKLETLILGPTADDINPALPIIRTIP